MEGRVRAELEKIGQQQLLRFWDKIDEEQREHLCKDIESLELERALKVFKETMSAKPSSKDNLAPLPAVEKLAAAGEKAEQWRKTGIDAAAKGKVGLVLLAGGQGTRLGTSDPKGMYNIGLPSGKSLFQLQAERLRRVQKLASEVAGQDVVIPWYVMTSPPTDEKTRSFFKDNEYFGLKKEDVFFFVQGALPCFDFDGNVLLEAAGSVTQAPDGNGGIYRALKRSGALADMEKRGVEFIHVYAVDNAIAKVADPTFIGYCIEKEADCGAKVVAKAHADEAVGVLALVDGKVGVVEYSEMSKEIAHSTSADGELEYNAGNICVHFYTRKFLEDVAELTLVHHFAKKKIPVANDDGEKFKPDENNGFKLEQFIFDVFYLSKNFAALEVVREEEFSPVKNAPGSKADSPDTARALLSNLHRRRLEAAGATIHGEGLVEVSPIVSYDGEGLDAVAKGKEFTAPIHIE
uniref:UDP-N-acetylglucosamine diphosphorylase n=1 Tax=Palpitomonas bilix TaxID=652834 RepID=A0A7S3LWH2_9EUKA